jgi:hypothetical protein
MHSTLNPNRSDPHAVFVDAPDVVPAAHADHTFSHDPHDAMGPSDQQASMESSFSAVPPVDTTFRATDVNNLKVLRGGRSMGTRAMRGLIGFLLAVCIGVAGALWQSHGDVAMAMIAKWVPQFVPGSSPLPQSPALAEQPGSSAVQPTEATAAPPQPEPTAQAAADTPAAAVASAAAAAVPLSNSAQLQAMAQDLANARQEIEQLKASVAQLKASQDQMSRDATRVSDVRTSEPAPRPRVMAPPSRPVAAPPPRPIAAPAPVHRPPPLRPSQASAAPVYSQPVYSQAAPPPPPMVRQVEPQPLPAQAEALPQVSSVPRPPASVPQ